MWRRSCDDGWHGGWPVGHPQINHPAGTSRTSTRSHKRYLWCCCRLMLASCGCWDPERGLSRKNFIGLVAQRELYKILGRRRRCPWTDGLPAPAEEPADHRASPESLVATREVVDRLLRRLRATLSPLGLRLFELLWLEERSIAAICQDTGLSRDAVYAWRSRLKRTASRLAAELW